MHCLNSKILNVTRLQVSTEHDVHLFDRKGKSFVEIPRKDNDTHNSWNIL